MGYHDKKYYKQRYEELDKANDRLRAEVDSLQNSIKFLLRQKNPHNIVYKATYKNILKKQMYNLFSEALNKTLPWGTLTGIRPTKIVLDKLNESIGDDEIKSYMLDTYLMDESKVDTVNFYNKHSATIIMNDVKKENEINE